MYVRNIPTNLYLYLSSRTFYRPRYSDRDRRLRVPFSISFRICSIIKEQQSTHEVVARRKWEGSAANPEEQNEFSMLVTTKVHGNA